MAEMIDFLNDMLRLIEFNLTRNISDGFRQELIICQECYKTMLNKALSINEESK